MPANYVLLEKITVGAAGASSVTFSGIPQTGYTDLVVKVSARQTTGDVAYANLRFNGSTTGYSYRSIEGDGSTAASYTSSAAAYGITNTSAYTANTFNNVEFYVPNYTGSNNKSWSSDSVTETNATGAYADLIAGLWSNSAAITSIQLFPNTGNFVQYSTFYLYGVAKLGTTPAIVPYATGGDTIMTDGTYWYHAFKASGTFTPAKGLSCDVLVVAGGGGGGAYTAGGGGAGGLVYAASQSLASGTGYTATIGAGGTAGLAGSGGNGTNSTFTGLTAAVGGGGGVYLGAGLSGGSGGGSGYLGGAGGAATSGQGFAGGVGSANGSNVNGGGGGGSTSVGVTQGNSSVGGNGGNGNSTYSAWLSATGLGISGSIAGGGGGGGRTGGGTGQAGGGNGGTDGVDNATAATQNTGSGGGGGGGYSGGQDGKAGGSGIVIVRYAV
jgi:hypothetical protein